MAAKLGSTDVSFRLGSGEVAAVYLGSQEVWTAAITLYFDGAVDGDWAELGNWWLDSGHTVAAPSLPSAGDSVIATASITSNSGGAVTVVNFTYDGSGGLLITITVTGNATFNDLATNGGTVTGDATFNDFAGNGGTVTGNATFNDSACNTGVVNGTITGSPQSCF